MGVRQDNVQVNVEINGQKAGESLKDIKKDASQLRRELDGLTPGTEAFKKKASELQSVNQRLQDINKDVKAVDKSNKEMLSEFANMGPFGQFFGMAKSGFNELKGGIGTGVKLFGTLRGAVIAVPIFALIALFTSLYAWIKKTDDGATFLDGIMRALGATFDVLINRLINIKQTFKDLFTNPGKFFKELGSDIKNAVEEGRALADLFDTLDQKRRDMELTNAEAEKEIARLLAMSKNKTLEDSKQLEILNQVTEKERARHAENQDYLKANLGALEREMALMAKQGTDSDEMRDKINQAKIALIKSEQESITLEEKINNRRDALLEKMEEKERKRKEDTAKHAAEIAKKKEEFDKKALAAEQAIQDLRVSLITDTFEREIAALELSTKRKIAALVGTPEQIQEQQKLIEEQLVRGIEEIEEKSATARQAARGKAFKLSLEEEDLRAEETRLRAEEHFFNVLATEEERDLARYEMQKTALEARLQLIKDFYGEESIEYLRANGALIQLQQDRQDQELDNERRTAELKKAIKADETAVMLDWLNIGIEFLGRDEEARKKNAIAIKAFSIGKVVADLAQEISGYFANPASSATMGALGAVKAIQAGIRAGLAINNIAKQKFAMGGLIWGPRHSQGGIAMIERNTGREVGEMEGGEIILTRGVAQNPHLRAQASQINAAGGGRMFEAGGVVNPLKLAYSAASSGSSAAGSQDNGGADPASLMVMEIRGLREDFKSLDLKVKAFVVLSELEAKSQELNEVKNDAAIKRSA